MENLNQYSKIELQKMGNDIKEQHETLKKEIVTDTYAIEELEKKLNEKVEKLQELEKNYMEILEKLI